MSSCEPKPYVDQDTAPISKQLYLRAARAGKFPSVKRFRRILALREDVDRWLTENTSVGRSPLAKLKPSDQAVSCLAEVGLRLVPR